MLYSCLLKQRPEYPNQIRTIIKTEIRTIKNSNLRYATNFIVFIPDPSFELKKIENSDFMYLVSMNR